MTDYLLLSLTDDGGLRATIARTSVLTAEVGERHRASPIATAALGYGLTGAALLGSLLKVQQRVVVKASGSGPLEKLIAEADSYGHSRAYVGQPQLAAHGPITSEKVAEAIGGGLVSCAMCEWEGLHMDLSDHFGEHHPKVQITGDYKVIEEAVR